MHVTTVSHIPHRSGLWSSIPGLGYGVAMQSSSLCFPSRWEGTAAISLFVVGWLVEDCSSEIDYWPLFANKSFANNFCNCFLHCWVIQLCLKKKGSSDNLLLLCNSSPKNPSNLGPSCCKAVALCDLLQLYRNAENVFAWIRSLLYPSSPGGGAV